ncbi:MAG: hypothetical protein EPN55_10635 [Gammaproteobacteria bacterium]|nr:MAG: hypothetical protein EPN55_10635 [Gammaproteobacteria bacterium]
MRPETDLRPTAYVVVALGVALAFVAAVVPHYDAGYRLDLPVLLAGLTPYLVYSLFTGFVRDRWLYAGGALLLVFDLAFKVRERFLQYDGYADGLVYLAPLAAAAVLALMLGLGARAHRATSLPPDESKPD